MTPTLLPGSPPLGDPGRPTPPALSRRALLSAAAALGVLAAAGCSVSDPRIHGDRPATNRTGEPPASPTPGPSPALPGAESGARAEEATAALAAALLASGAKLSSDQRTVVTAARDAHRLHAAVLRTPDPTARSTAGSTPGPTPVKPRTVSLAALIAAEKTLAGRHAKLVGTSRGLTALLFGSLSVAGTTFAGALGAGGRVPITSTPAAPRTPGVLADVAGIQAVVSQLHALIYGYQVAIGRLPVGSTSHGRALADLAERRALRDQLTAVLISRTATVPVAEPAYATPSKVRSAGAATALIAAMETAFVPFTGQWLASAAQPADQQLAWAGMRRAAALARGWGGPVGAWPGWPG
ncbi:MAG TPA: DUF4439 domain-containing protein [Microlunatus sp.]|nr:DUF4439 domain-containing protein [Microlunatus sp.]